MRIQAKIIADLEEKCKVKAEEIRILREENKDRAQWFAALVESDKAEAEERKAREEIFESLEFDKIIREKIESLAKITPITSARES
ncbi:MAG: hypothetical protein LBT59_22775 [Clostridiales bacterium]|nr:hypothetical protein [Clostridiales bacterium]